MMVDSILADMRVYLLRAKTANGNILEMTLNPVEIDALVAHIDHLRSLAGAVSQGESFDQIAHRAGRRSTEPAEKA